jgi:hypothetical protein
VKSTLNRLLTRINCNYDIILTGDFNINQLNNNINDKIGSLMTQFSLHQLITEPTYVTEHSSSLLDLILVSINISPGLQITSWWDIECAVQVFIYYLALFLTIYTQDYLHEDQD